MTFRLHNAGNEDHIGLIIFNGENFFRHKKPLTGTKVPDICNLSMNVALAQVPGP
jgi:hypothetical protein